MAALQDRYLSTTEVASIIGISRVAVFQRIRRGEIQAFKVGRNYIVDRRSLGPVFQEASQEQIQWIEEAVTRVVDTYSELMKGLGAR